MKKKNTKRKGLLSPFLLMNREEFIRTMDEQNKILVFSSILNDSQLDGPIGEL